MKLLITGGCGFLGSNLALDSLSRGDELVIFDNLSRDGSRENLAWLKNQGQFSFEYGDIRSQNDITRVIKNFKPDTVFHLAGQVAMTTSIVDPHLDFDTNALGTLNLLEAIRLYSPEATIIYSSTNKVYGDLEQFSYQETDTRYSCIESPAGFDESCQLDFHSPYGCSKGAADQYVLDYSRIFGLKTLVFRHSSMYGGRQFSSFDQGWVGWFCRQAVNQKFDPSHDFTISGSGKQVRDVLHAEDMKTLYFKATQQIDKVKGQALNVGGGVDNSLSLLELFALLNELLSMKLKYKLLPPRESDQRVFIADISKASSLLSWTPRIGVKDGVSLMLDWIQET